jgi:hypothetical protein
MNAFALLSLLWIFKVGADSSAARLLPLPP